MKKLYRDKDKGTIAGVCTGLGHYLGVDGIWVKILLIIITLAGFGTGIIAYLTLWAIVPKAVTTSEKLEMTGEPVNISSIKNKVSEEFDNVTNKIKNVDYDKVGNQLKATSESAGNKIGNLLITLFGVFAKVLGALILVLSAILLLAVCIEGIILICSSSLPTYALMNHISTPFDFDTPFWLQGILFLSVFGIPLFFLLILGLKLLITNLKSMGNPIKYSLLGIWVIALSFLIFLGIKETSKNAFGLTLESKSVRNRIVNEHLANALKSNPSPIYSQKFASRITTGNTTDDMPKIATCDWIIEVVVERLDIKKIVFEQIDKSENQVLW